MTAKTALIVSVMVLVAFAATTSGLKCYVYTYAGVPINQTVYTLSYTCTSSVSTCFRMETTTTPSPSKYTSSSTYITYEGGCSKCTSVSTGSNTVTCVECSSDNCNSALGLLAPGKTGLLALAFALASAKLLF